MKNPIVYDKAEYHYGGNYPKDLKKENAFTHTGMFLGWLIDNDLVSSEFIKETGDSINKYKKREISPIEIYKEWDGCLIDDMLNDEGNAFTEVYFDFEKGNYLVDYENLFAINLPTLYHVSFTWDKYDKLCKIIDDKYREWKNTISKQ